MMAAQRSTMAGDKCTHSKEGLHADTESGCQVQYITVQYSTVQQRGAQFSKEGTKFSRYHLFVPFPIAYKDLKEVQ